MAKNTSNTFTGYKKQSKIYAQYIKRVLDIIISFFALLIIALPMLIVAILIKIDSPGPVIFKQKRLGKDGKEFDILKFRSMCQNAEHSGSGVYSGAGDPRVTKIGKFIRKTSIDELPQFINVLKGDMSILGPRPPLTYHPWPIDQYTEEQRKMFNVRPGLSGWAQVNGRKDVEWNRRIELNVWYVEHMTFSLDVKIFFLTIASVLSGKDNENTTNTVKNR